MFSYFTLYSFTDHSSTFVVSFTWILVHDNQYLYQCIRGGQIVYFKNNKPTHHFKEVFPFVFLYLLHRGRISSCYKKRKLLNMSVLSVWLGFWFRLPVAFHITASRSADCVEWICTVRWCYSSRELISGSICFSL